jgi:hypothetical protein
MGLQTKNEQDRMVRFDAPDAARAMASMLDAVREGELSGAQEGNPNSDALNDAEAANVAFIVSDRFARDTQLRISIDEKEGDSSIAELAAKVSKRLGDLSLRLSDVRSNAILDDER